MTPLDDQQPEPDDIPSETHHSAFSRPDTKGPRPSYTEEQKALALAVYAECGSLDTASQHTSIPRNTIRYWVENDDQIDATLDSLRRVLRERMAWKYAEAAELALHELIDRLKDGDYHVDKEGNITRRKVPARELAFITSVCGDKHALLTGTLQKQKGEDQALTALAGKLVTALEARARRDRAVAVPHEPVPASQE